MNSVNKSQKSKSSRNVLAICCTFALITAASLAVSADSQSLRSAVGDGERTALDRNRVGSPVSSGYEYPDTETMLSMYQEARKSGILDDSTYTTTPTPAILRSAYRYITEYSAINSSTSSPQGEALGLTTSNSSLIGLPTQTRAATTCRAATLDCLYKAAQFGINGFSEEQKAKLFVCSMAAAGRNQDSPVIDSGCTNIMEGAAACALANDLCGVTSNTPTLASGFVGVTNTGSETKDLTCGNLTGGIKNDRILELGLEMHTVAGVRRATSVFIKCSSLKSSWVGYNYQLAGSTRYKTRCPLSSIKATAPEGIKVNLANRSINSLSLRCDDSVSASPASDSYATAIGGGPAPTTIRSECLEGYTLWGVSLKFNSPSDPTRYLTGMSFFCRK